MWTQLKLEELTFTMSTNAFSLKKISNLLDSNGYLSGSLIVSVGMLIASFLNYVLQFFLVKVLSIEDFGLFGALNSVSYFVGFPIGVISISVVKIVTELHQKEDPSVINTLFIKLSGYSVIFGTLAAAFIFFQKHNLLLAFKISNPTILYSFLFYICIIALASLPAAFLQGLLKYKYLAYYYIFFSLVRLVFPLAAESLGYGLSGVFGGIVLSVFASYFFSVFFIFENRTFNFRTALKNYYVKIIAFSVSVFAVNFALTFLNNIDIVMVKRFFDPVSAGYYAGVVLVGKIFLFGAGSVSTVAFSVFSTILYKKGNYRQEFYKYFSFQFLVALVVFLIFYNFPEFIVQIFFGSKFSPSVTLLPVYSLFILIYILINFIITFLLAIEKTKVFLYLIPGVIFQFTNIYLNHESLSQIIRVNVYTGIITLVLLITFVFTSFKNEEKTVSISNSSGI